MALPQLPAPTEDFISYVAENPEAPIHELLYPYSIYEAKLREVFAQYPEDEAIRNNHINAVPLFAGQEHNLKVRARDTSDEMLNSKYIVPLKEERKTSGSAAMVESFGAFKKNFNLFSESSLADLNWNNVVVAGSAVVNSLLPISKEHGESTRALRTYYHEQLAPSSDVDLFLWGLTKEQAIEKIKEIEKSVKDSILAETTTIRTKNAITIASQYPTRHIQIVLRLYKSISEILTGFDVDSSCFAYDGSQIYGTPRGIAAFLTQSNVIDLSRRSPSYENRLFKYATRGFEIYCPDLDRARIDPTIYERAFARVQGLARLLVLERLPKELDRDDYRAQRRQERARPYLREGWKNRRGKLMDNLKDKDPQDVAEWVMEEQDDVSNYHSFTVPYGPRYNAKKIEKLVYTKDLLLNAEWNNKGKRTVNLHRHPCFVGDAEYIVADCCTACPLPETEEEKEIAAVESKIYVSGDIKFLENDPGRQQIGSFNPLTSDDWTDQAYLGNTESLCHAIVGGDIDFVRDWCSTNQDILDRRDHTGRTPLQLASQIGAADMVKILVDSGARMVARLTDGLTALHIACINGNVEIINILMEKSEANEELEAEKENHKRQQNTTIQNSSAMRDKEEHKSDVANSEMDSDEDLVNSDDEGSSTFSMTQGSFVKVKAAAGNEEAIMEEETKEPDVYDVNVLAWDAPVSPLHLAIICGHTEVIKLLVSKFGADVLLPVKLLNEHDNSPSGAILTLVLAAHHSERSVEITRALLDLGASPSQSDMNEFSALHSVALLGNVNALKVMMDRDLPKAKAALNHIIVDVYAYMNSTRTPLSTVIAAKDEKMVFELLKAGANPTIPFDDWAKAFVVAATSSDTHISHDKNTVAGKFIEIDQPIIDAANFDLPAVVEALLDAGVDVNQLNSNGLKLTANSTTPRYNTGLSLLDIINSKITTELPGSNFVPAPDPPKLLSDYHYLHVHEIGTYQHWQIQNQYVLSDEILRDWQRLKDDYKKSYQNSYHAVSDDDIEKARQLRQRYCTLKTRLLAAGAKKFEELFPGVHPSGYQNFTSQGQLSSTKVESDPGTIQLVTDFEVPSVHDTDTARYMELFEATWTGKRDKIKHLTTMPGPNGNVLRIAVRDNMGISPLHIAIFRGEYEIAELMLEIASLQHIPPQGKSSKRRYYIRDDQSDGYDSDGGNGERDGEDFYVSSELVNDDFTIDDLATLAQQAGSKTSAIEFLQWQSPFWMFASLPGAHNASSLRKVLQPEKNNFLQNWNQRRTAIGFFEAHLNNRSNQNKTDTLEFAIDTGNVALTKLYFKWAKAFGRKDSNRVSYFQTMSSQSSYLFRALKRGQIDIASELVLNSGAGMPIRGLAKAAGVQSLGTNKYYQGLLLRGKHKQDWAKQANKTAENDGPDNSMKTSLLLQAAGSDSVGAVEWCLSDSPARLLKQWLRNSDDEQVQQLVKANGGLDKLVDDWLDSRQNLAIHMAVLSSKWDSDDLEQRSAAAEILKYLIRVLPESLETKNVSGYTPLALAFWTRKVEAASILISAGANQATRDYRGANIVHLALHQKGTWTEEHVESLQKSLSLIDQSLIKSLFVERCSIGPTGGLTPLAVWLSTYSWHVSRSGKHEIGLSILKLLIVHMDHEPLGMVDGGGQMPIHSCVKRNWIILLKYLCDQYPELVLLENGMGQTASELCSSLCIAEATRKDTIPSTSFSRHSYYPIKNHSFQDPPAHSTALTILQSAGKDVSTKKRILISSLQASEVAKRLADAKQGDKAHRQLAWSYIHGYEDRPQDEVRQWLTASGYLDRYRQ